MSIKPIQRIKQFIQNNEIARQNAAKALENLQELYGDKVEYYSIYNSKNGTVSALGFKKGCTPYSCASASLRARNASGTSVFSRGKSTHAHTTFWVAHAVHSAFEKTEPSMSLHQPHQSLPVKFMSTGLPVSFASA